MSKKKSIIRARVEEEKYVPRDHRLSSLGKPRDAKGRIFYHTLSLMIDVLY